MPELPEVETMVRGIRPHVAGRPIAAVRRCRCCCRPILLRPHIRTISRRASGATVERVDRLAKRVVLSLSTGDSFVIEPRMTGLLLVADPPNRKHLRIRWEFAGARPRPVLWFWDRRGLGTVRLYSKAEMSEALGSHAIGPDALEMSERMWRERCAATSRPIKTALLDQKWVAGIGNLYACEILHAARIHPVHPASDLKGRRIRRLAAATRQVLAEAIRCEGSTLSDGTYRTALNSNGSYQNKHRAYGRTGRVCRSCRRGRIRRIVQAQRATFYCPVCQR